MKRTVQAYQDAQGNLHAKQDDAVAADLCQLLDPPDGDSMAKSAVNRLLSDGRLRAKVVKLLQEVDAPYPETLP